MRLFTLIPAIQAAQAAGVQDAVLGAPLRAAFPPSPTVRGKVLAPAGR